MAEVNSLHPVAHEQTVTTVNKSQNAEINKTNSPAIESANKVKLLRSSISDGYTEMTSEDFSVTESQSGETPQIDRLGKSILLQQEPESKIEATVTNEPYVEDTESQGSEENIDEFADEIDFGAETLDSTPSTEPSSPAPELEDGSVESQNDQEELLSQAANKLIRTEAEEENDDPEMLVEEAAEGEALSPERSLPNLSDDQLSPPPNFTPGGIRGAQQPLAPPPSAPINSLQKIQEVQNRIAQNPNLDSQRSPQSILSSILKELATACPGATFNITADLAKTGNQYDTKPFTHEKFPGKTLYKAEAHYNIEVNFNGQIYTIPALKGELFTTADDPGKALAAASKFKETIIELTKFDLGLPCNLEGIPADATKRNDVMNQRSFSYQFAKDSSGKLGISFIKAGDVKLTMKKDEAEGILKEYAYIESTGELKRVQPGEDLGNQKITYYATEEEALLNIRHDAKDLLYSELEKHATQGFEERIASIKDEIKEKEAEIEQVKKAFKEKTFLRKEVNTKEFNQFIASFDPETATTKSSPAMQRYLSQKEDLVNENQELKMLQGWNPTKQPPVDPNSDLGQLITRIKTDHQLANNASRADVIRAKQQEKDKVEVSFKEAKKEVEKEQAIFIQGLNQLQTSNKALTSTVKQLEEARQEAENRIADPQADHKKAQFFLKGFTESEIKRLQNKIQANNQLIEEIRSHLPPEMQREGEIRSTVIGIVDDISHLNSKGEELLKEARFDEAAIEFKEVLKINRNDATALAGYAEVLRQNGQLKEAAPLFVKALKINPTNSLALKHYGDLLRSTHQTGTYPPEAIKIYSDAAKEINDKLEAIKDKKVRKQLEKENRFVWLIMAEVLHSQGKFSLAEDYLKRAWEGDQKNLLVLKQYAKTLQAQNKLSQAQKFEKAFDKAIDDLNAQALSALEEAYTPNLDPAIRQDKLMMSEQLSREVLIFERDLSHGVVDEAKDNYAMALSIRAKDASQQGDLAEAERLYKAALKINPNDSLISFNYATLLKDRGVEFLQNGRFAEAERLFKASLAKNSATNIEAEGGLADALAGQEKWAEAESAYQYLAETYPEEATYFDKRQGELLLKQQKYAEAQEFFTERLEGLDKSNPDYLDFSRGLKRANDGLKAQSPKAP